MLTSKDGMTLYICDKAKDGSSTCFDECAENWPPYVGKEGDIVLKDWALVKRLDGTLQWAYDGKPLYFCSNDKDKGDMRGDGHAGIWHIIKDFPKIAG